MPNVRLRDIEGGSEQVSQSEEVPQLPTRCVHCGAESLYVRRLSSAGHGSYLLAGLGHFFHYAQFDVVVCAKCGLTRFFAEPSARERLPNDHWARLGRHPEDSQEVG